MAYSVENACATKDVNGDYLRWVVQQGNSVYKTPVATNLDYEQATAVCDALTQIEQKRKSEARYQVTENTGNGFKWYYVWDPINYEAVAKCAKRSDAVRICAHYNTSTSKG